MMKRKLLTISIISIIIITYLSSSISLSAAVRPKSFDLITSDTPGCHLNDPDFDQNISRLMQEAKMTSLSACIIVNDSIEWYGGFGSYRGYYNPLLPDRFKEPTEHTVYMAASISKTITATALLQLYENESYEFDLDDDVNKYLPFSLRNPYFPNTNITFRMLLNHTSGLNDHTSFFFILTTWLSNWIGGYPHSFFKIVTNLPICWRDDAPPGKDFQYSNYGYGLLEYLIEIISKQPFEKYCKENIFEPLGMYNTSFHKSDFKRRQLAVPYFWINPIGLYIRLPHYDVPNSGAGGLRTTISDLSHFLIAHINNGVYNNSICLNETTVNLMHNHSSTPSLFNYIAGYGLGWFIYNSSIYGMNYSGHDGDTFGCHGIMRMNPDKKIGIIFFWDTSHIYKKDSGHKLWDVWWSIEEELLKKAKELANG